MLIHVAQEMSCYAFAFNHISGPYCTCITKMNNSNMNSCLRCQEKSDLLIYVFKCMKLFSRT